MGMNMDQYTPEFTIQGIDGLQLMNLDSEKLKVGEYLKCNKLEKKTLIKWLECIVNTFYT